MAARLATLTERGSAYMYSNPSGDKGRDIHGRPSMVLRFLDKRGSVAYADKYPAWADFWNHFLMHIFDVLTIAFAVYTAHQIDVTRIDATTGTAGVCRTLTEIDTHIGGGGTNDLPMCNENSAAGPITDGLSCGALVTAGAAGTFPGATVDQMFWSFIAAAGLQSLMSVLNIAFYVYGGKASMAGVVGGRSNMVDLGGRLRWLTKVAVFLCVLNATTAIQICDDRMSEGNMHMTLAGGAMLTSLFLFLSIIGRIVQSGSYGLIEYVFSGGPFAQSGLKTHKRYEYFFGLFAVVLLIVSWNHVDDLTAYTNFSQCDVSQTTFFDPEIGTAANTAANGGVAMTATPLTSDSAYSPTTLIKAALTVKVLAMALAFGVMDDSKNSAMHKMSEINPHKENNANGLVQRVATAVTILLLMTELASLNMCGQVIGELEDFWCPVLALTFLVLEAYCRDNPDFGSLLGFLGGDMRSNKQCTYSLGATKADDVVVQPTFRTPGRLKIIGADV